jgi:uncharacterized protein
VSDLAPPAPARVPAIEGWFTTDDQPALLGNRCTSCATVFFPKASFFCPNPACAGEEFEETKLSRVGRVWSFTDAQYQPPPPYVPRGDTYTPFAIAAVELADEQMVVLGQVADGFTVDDLHIGQQVELVVEELFSSDKGEHVVWKWRPIGASS